MKPAAAESFDLGGHGVADVQDLDAPISVGGKSGPVEAAEERTDKAMDGGENPDSMRQVCEGDAGPSTAIGWNQGLEVVRQGDFEVAD